MLIHSATTACSSTSHNEIRDEKDDDNDNNYSEWKLLEPKYEQVVMNSGFHIRDFQRRTHHQQQTTGGSSVIDPEVFGKLRKEALAIRNHTQRREVASALCLIPSILVVVALKVTLSMSMLPSPLSALLYPLDILMHWWWFEWLLYYGGFVVTVFYIPYRLEQNAVDKLTALVESYQPFFLKAYGIELGYNRFKGFRHLRLGVSCLAGISLRCPRRPAVLVDEEEVPGGDNVVLEDGHEVFPPIYIIPLIPGELHMQEKGYDAASMKVDAETWALLQSTHQETMARNRFRDIVFILLVATGFCYGYLLCIVVGCLFIYPRLSDYQLLRAYEDVTKAVNAVLQKDDDQKKSTQHLALEFCVSEHPGREGEHSRRYQFVRCSVPAAAPGPSSSTTTTHEMGTTSCWEKKGISMGEQDGLRGRRKE